MVTRRLKGARVVMARSGPRGAPGDMDPAEWDALQANVAAKVGKTGNESIAGTKTFSASPVVPTPTANGHAAPKSYIDGLIEALTTLLNALQSFVNTHVARTDNPHNVTKVQVGLGNVDNTSDMDKPISRAARAVFSSHAHRLNWHDVTLTAHDGRLDGHDTTLAWHADVLVPEAHRIEGDILWMGPGGPQWHQLDDVLNGVNTSDRYGHGAYDSGGYQEGGA